MHFAMLMLESIFAICIHHLRITRRFYTLLIGADNTILLPTISGMKEYARLLR